MGQADGFNIEMLSQLEGVRDPKGKEIKELILKVYFEQEPEKAKALIEDLGPLFANCGRMINKTEKKEEKDKDGNITSPAVAAGSLSKSVRVKIEDLEGMVTKLKAAFDVKQNEFTNGQTLIDDPTDLFKMRIPGKFAEAEDSVKKMLADVDKAKVTMAEILAFWHATQMIDFKDKAKKKKDVSSEDLCLLWDDFFVPGSVFD